MPAIPSPLVSILVPTYKRAALLRAALQSALAQTYSAIEVLVLDDASPDDTPQVVAEFAHDPRIRSLRHAANRGIVGNWKAGIDAARGAFFCLLHDDDLFEPQFVERLLSPLLADDSLVLSFCDHWIIDAQGQRCPEDTEAAARTYGRAALPPGRVADFPRAALEDVSIPIGATLFRRSVVGPDAVEPGAKGAVDDWLLYQCARTGGGAFYVPERLMSYRVHPGGMSVSMDQHVLEGRVFCCRHILGDPAMVSVHGVLRRKLAQSLRDYGFGLLAEGRRRDARVVLGEALGMEREAKTVVAYGLSWAGAAGTKAAHGLRRLRRA